MRKIISGELKEMEKTTESIHNQIPSINCNGLTLNGLCRCSRDGH